MLSLTDIVRHIFRMARSTNFKLGIRMEDDVPHQPQARHDLQGQKSRSKSHVISLSRLGPMLYLCYYRPAGADRVGRTRRSHFLFLLAKILVGFYYAAPMRRRQSYVFGLPVRPFVCYQTCQRDILKTSELIDAIGTRDPPGDKSTKRSALGFRSSKVKITRGQR